MISSLQTQGEGGIGRWEREGRVRTEGRGERVQGRGGGEGWKGGGEVRAHRNGIKGTSISNSEMRSMISSRQTQGEGGIGRWKREVGGERWKGAGEVEGRGERVEWRMRAHIHGIKGTSISKDCVSGVLARRSGSCAWVH